MPKRSVTLTEHFQRFIDAAVASGRYADASDLIRDALRLLEQREHEDAASAVISRKRCSLRSAWLLRAQGSRSRQPRSRRRCMSRVARQAVAGR